MKHLKLKNPFNIPLPVDTHRAPEVRHATAPPTIAVSPSHFRYVKPRLLVKMLDRIKAGTPLFYDKRDPSVRLLSPVSGIVQNITFGHRRCIDEIVIEPSPNGSGPYYEPLSMDQITRLSREDTIELLKTRGIWPFIHQFPYKDIPKTELNAKLAIICLQSTDPFAPLPRVMIRQTGTRDYLTAALAIMSILANEVIVAAPVSEMPYVNHIRELITHSIHDRYPASDPKVILYQVRKHPGQNTALSMDIQDFLDMGACLLTGSLPTTRLYRICSDVTAPGIHVLAQKGSPASFLLSSVCSDVSKLEQKNIVASGLFSGRLVQIHSHMRHFESSLVCIDREYPEEPFGFVVPGFEKASESNTFLSRVTSRIYNLDSTVHGEHRPCINCGYCQKKCPVELFPQFIMKACLAGEEEEAIELGMLDCTLCGLCSFVCPSKIELSDIIEQAMNQYYKERVTI